MVAVNLETKSFFNKKMIKYCDRLGISELPLLIFTKEELKLAGYTPKQIQHTYKHELGLSWYKGQLDNVNQSVVYLNLENSDFLWQMIDILIHELIHIRFPDLEHGDEFQCTINEVIMGKRF